MVDAVQNSVRTKNVPWIPFSRVIADELTPEQFFDRHILDIGPGQCDFLDLAKKQGAHTHGVDFDPAVVKLGQLRGHEMRQANLMRTWPYETGVFDGIFCRGSINCYWFASNIEALEEFLCHIQRALKPNGWLWIAPWNRPSDGSDCTSDRVAMVVKKWADQNGIEIWLPSRKYVRRYGIGYKIPRIEVWRKNTNVRAGVSDIRLFSERNGYMSILARQASETGKKLERLWRLLSGHAHLPIRKPEPDPEVVALRAWIDFLRPRLREQEVPTVVDQSPGGLIGKGRDDSTLPPAPLPLSYYEEGLRLLIDRGDVEFITYDDLNWSDDWNYHKRYPGEWSAWRKSLANKSRDTTKCYVLIQHDCDTGPVATVKMARLDQQLGIRSNIMVFERWRRGNDVVPYPIDWEALHELRDRGFVIGYHCNAFHNSDFDEGGAYEEFIKDYDRMLSRGLDVRYFSAHGGRASADGRVNSSLDYPLICGRHQLRWVHNRFSPRFASTFSDGALTVRLKQNHGNLDFHGWAKSLKPGCRYRALIHAQYYTDGKVIPVPDVSLTWYLDAVAPFRDL